MAGPFLQRPDLAALNSMLVGTAAESLGIRLTELGEDFLRASVLLAETLASFAGHLCLDPAARKQAAGLEINANHIRAVTAGTVTGTARPVHLGRATHVWEIRLEDERGRLTCLARMTAAVIDA